MGEGILGRGVDDGRAMEQMKDGRDEQSQPVGTVLICDASRSNHPPYRKPRCNMHAVYAVHATE